MAGVTVLAGLAAVVTPASAATPDPGAFVAVGPTRALDTRTTGGALAQGQTRTLSLSGQVPSTSATAVVLTLTVTAPTAAGYLTVFPTGSARPLASSINKRAGETRSNSVTIALPGNGSRNVSIYNQLGSTQVVVDVAGYYDPNALFTGSAYHPTTPSRVFDTRTFTSGVDAGEIDDVTVPNPQGLTDVTAVAVNVTVVHPGGPGYVTLWNGVGPRPLASTVNYGYDEVTPNFAVVPVKTAADGTLSLRIQNMIVDTGGEIIDLVGYYGAVDDAGTLYVPVPPTRQHDTRTGGGPLQAGANRALTSTGLGSSTRALNLNVTAVDATAPTYVTVFKGGDVRPPVSTLNPFTPAAVANAAQPEVSQLGGGTFQYSVYDFAGTVNYVDDLQGYFTLVVL